jgi:hypothetical protein
MRQFSLTIFLLIRLNLIESDSVDKLDLPVCLLSLNASSGG